MRTEDTDKKFRRWPPRVKRRRPDNTTAHHAPSEAAKPRDTEPEAETGKSVRVSYRARRCPTRHNRGA